MDRPELSGRDIQGRFAAGNSGRPKGSRNRLTNRLSMALERDPALGAAEAAGVGEGAGP